jgi:hypothetical protein
MYLPVFLIIFLLVLLLLLANFRIHVELIAKDADITYTIKGTILKYIPIFEIKSGTEKKGRKKWRLGLKEKKTVRTNFLNLIAGAIRKNRGKMLHIEKLELTGSFSVEDAAVNAIIYGIILVLWNYFIITLSAWFSLEHGNFSLIPDFQNNANRLMFHAVFRVMLLNVFILLLFSNDKQLNFNTKTHSAST